jgi:acylpyruvate hydrolase
MRYANCQDERGTFAAVIDGDFVRPLNGVPPLSAGLDWDVVTQASTGDPRPLAEMTLLAPVLSPKRIICLGLNYRGHVTETGRELPSYPVLFTKFADALVGPYAEIIAPPESAQMDYEAEMAVVIGRHARRVGPADVNDVIAGFTVANDVTMRDYQRKTHQWLQGKAWPRSTPLGPQIVTGDEIDWGRACDIRLELNGQELQHSNTSLMIFDVPTTISTLSEFVAFEPGDVILMGTPDGVGDRRTPQVTLSPGDLVRVEIDGIGAIENRVVAEDVG